MNLFYIFIFGLYHIIKSSKSNGYDEDSPLDYSMDTLNKHLKKDAERKAENNKHCQRWNPYRSVYTNRSTERTIHLTGKGSNVTFPTLAECFECKSQANIQSTPRTISFSNDISSGNSILESRYTSPPINVDPPVKTYDSPSVENNLCVSLEMFRIIYNCNLFVSTILTNIISIYKLEKISESDVLRIISAKQHVSISEIFYVCLNNIKFQLKSKHFVYDVYNFHQIEQALFQDKEMVSKVFHTIFYSQNLKNFQLSYKNILERKKLVEYLLYKIRTTEGASTLFSSIIPSILFFYEESKHVDSKARTIKCVNVFILKMIYILKVVEYAQTQTNCFLLDFYRKVKALIEIMSENFFVNNMMASYSRALLINQKNKIITQVKEGTYLGPKYLLENWFCIVFLKPQRVSLGSFFECLENNAETKNIEHLNSIFDILMNVSELFH